MASLLAPAIRCVFPNWATGARVWANDRRPRSWDMLLLYLPDMRSWCLGVGWRPPGDGQPLRTYMHLLLGICVVPGPRHRLSLRCMSHTPTPQGNAKCK
jgi:hypothetical protein